MAYGKIKADTLVWDNSGSDVETTVQSLTTPTPEGTVVKSTTNSNEAATKFLRADGDGTCSWQVPPTLTLVDEDNMSSNSATSVPSQQSVKAYVDGKVPTSITVADESSDTTCFPLFVTAATGDLAPKTGTNITFNASTGKLVIGGDLQVDGTTTTVNSSTMTVTDKNIEIAKGAANDAAADGAGITVDSGDGDKTWNWVDVTDAWTSSEHIHLGDNKKLLVGSGPDTELYFTGSDTILDHTPNSGTVRVRGNALALQTSESTPENYLTADAGAGLSLYFNNVKTFETVTNGIQVTGTEGQPAYIYMYADEGDDNADKWIHAAENDGTFAIKNYSSGSWVQKLSIDGSGNITGAGSISDAKGNLRSIPSNAQSSAYVAVAADAGKAIYISSGGVTINNSVFSVGDAVTIINNSGSNQTITQGSSFTLYNSADASSGNRTLAGRGMATIWFESHNQAYISGAGLS